MTLEASAPIYTAAFRVWLRIGGDQGTALVFGTLYSSRTWCPV
jgi:hypothetical protein